MNPMQLQLSKIPESLSGSNSGARQPTIAQRFGALRPLQRPLLSQQKKRPRCSKVLSGYIPTQHPSKQTWYH